MLEPAARAHVVHSGWVFKIGRAVAVLVDDGLESPRARLLGEHTADEVREMMGVGECSACSGAVRARSFTDLSYFAQVQSKCNLGLAYAALS